MVKGRSYCPACNKQIRWYDNIPLLSYIFLKAKCRDCSTRIGIKYFIVELICALSFVLVFYLFGFSLTTLLFFILSIFFVIIFFIDLKHFIIPNQLTYGIDIYMNPKGNISNYNDFIYYDNGLTSKLKLKMPLSLIAENLVLTDTVGIDFSSFNNESNINSATLTLIVNNSYALLASIEIISLDQYNLALDTLLSNSIIQNGNINSMGIVTESSHSEIVFGIDNEKLDLLKEAVKLYIVASLSTPTTTTQHIDIYDSYNLDIKLIADFNYSITN